MKQVESNDNVFMETLVDSMLQEEDERQRMIRKLYLERNKERIKGYHQKYYKETREKRIKIASDYYEANKDQKNEKAVCGDCGQQYTLQNKKRHQQSKFHEQGKT